MNEPTVCMSCNEKRAFAAKRCDNCSDWEWDESSQEREAKLQAEIEMLRQREKDISAVADSFMKDLVAYRLLTKESEGEIAKLRSVVERLRKTLEMIRRTKGLGYSDIFALCDGALAESADALGDRRD